ncbi:MAG: CYTH domain-containing protein [Chloroflexota bacterium]|nr:CYTH domain-containing protein [Chloroflexota bacterium]
MNDKVLVMVSPAPILLRGEAKELLRQTPMEIEAKFTVPDPVVYWSLQTTDNLAGYSLSTTQVKPVWDTYLDTKRQRLLGAGYSCRRRVTREGIVITLKSLGGAEGAVHHRRKYELSMKTSRPPVDWPDSPVRDLVLQLIGQEPLLTFFELRQTCVIRMLKEDDQPVAELSLDSVSLVTDETEQVYLVLEVKLLPQTPQETLMTIVGCLQDVWNLKSEPLSKFERALVLLDVL